MPRAVLTPASAMAAAMKQTLRGARNGMDPDNKTRGRRHEADAKQTPRSRRARNGVAWCTPGRAASRPPTARKRRAHALRGSADLRFRV
eukprot:1050025-Prorocentrum_minimum.AAC.1